jgi:hypothetical protein
MATLFRFGTQAVAAERLLREPGLTVAHSVGHCRTHGLDSI